MEEDNQSILSGALTLVLFLAAVFLILLLVSKGDKGWAWGGMIAILTTGAVLSAASTIYSFFNFLGYKTAYRPMEIQTSGTEHLRVSHVLVLVVLTLFLVALAFGAGKVGPDVPSKSPVCKDLKPGGLSVRHERCAEP